MNTTRTYEMFLLSDPQRVIGIQRASSPEEALEKEAKLHPEHILDTTILTLITRQGAIGPRAAG